MKKIVFTLMTVFVLAIMAGSAYAQTNTTPFQGGTYSYSLGGIYSVPGATVNIVYLTGSGATISNIKINGSSVSTVTAITASTLTFDVTYSTSATDGKIKVTVTDDAPTSCSNFIELAIDVKDKPTIDLAIVGSVADLCQNLKTAPDNNVDASIGAATNSFTFTVTPTIVNEPTSGTYTYDYTLTLPTVAIGLTGYTITRTTGTGTWTEATGKVVGASTTANEVYTITFTTTTGIDSKTITGTLSAVSLSTTSGSGNYPETVTTNNEKSVTVNTMPSIGSFN